MQSKRMYRISRNKNQDGAGNGGANNNALKRTVTANAIGKRVL